MITTTFNNRKVDIVEIDHGSDPVDSFIQSAYYVDTKAFNIPFIGRLLVSWKGSFADLTDTECEELTQETDFHESWYEHKICQAEDAYDSAMDR